ALRRLRQAETAGSPYELVLFDEKTPGLAQADLGVKLRRGAGGAGSAADDGRAPSLVMLVGTTARERVLELVGSLPPDLVLAKPITPSRLFDAIVMLQNR